MIATDAQGVIQIFNVGAERMLGSTASEVLNKITPADISDSQEVIARANAMLPDVERGLKAGFLRYITTPIKVNEFVEALNVALAFASTHHDTPVGTGAHHD